MTPRHKYQLISFEDFDVLVAQSIGLYLGKSITAEELQRQIGAAGSQGNHDGIFPTERTGQSWHYYDGTDATFEAILQGDFEFFAPDYTNGPAPERVSYYDSGEYPEEGLRRRIVEDWIPQLEANYGPGIVTITEPDQEYLNRRLVLAANLADIHTRYVDGRLSGIDFANTIIFDFRNRRDAEDLHHYQFEAAIWDAGVLEGSVIDVGRDEFAYDGRGPARRRLNAILDAFPKLS